MEPTNLSVIENGESNPRILTYALIASALSEELSTIVTIELILNLLANKQQVIKQGNIRSEKNLLKVRWTFSVVLRLITLSSDY